MVRSAAAATAAAVLLLGAGCATVSRNAGVQAPGSSAAAVISAGVQTLTVTAGPGDRFQQTSLTASTGAVTIVLDAIGNDAHDLTFSDGPHGGTSEVHDGTQSVTLTFRQPGTYHFLCTIHPQMRGTLVITR